MFIGPTTFPIRGRPGYFVDVWGNAYSTKKGSWRKLAVNIGTGKNNHYNHVNAGKQSRHNEEHGRCKIADKCIPEIIRKYESKECNLRELAEAHLVSITQIHRIIKRKNRHTTVHKKEG